MSHFIFHDPDDDSYIVQLNEHGETDFQAALEDQQATNREIAEHASEWYESLWNAPSWEPPLDVRPLDHNTYLSSSSIPFPSPSPPAIDPNLTIVPTLAHTPTLTTAQNTTTTPAQYNHIPEGHPSAPLGLMTRLKEAKAESLVYLAMDTANFLWIHMSLKTLGRIPTPNLCENLYIEVIQCLQRIQADWVPENGTYSSINFSSIYSVSASVTVTLSVPVMQNSNKFNFLETPMVTRLDNQLFKEAIFAQVTYLPPTIRAINLTERAIVEDSGLRIPQARFSML
jgi:hypothetical protein